MAESARAQHLRSSANLEFGGSADGIAWQGCETKRFQLA